MSFSSDSNTDPIEACVVDADGRAVFGQAVSLQPDCNTPTYHLTCADYSFVVKTYMNYAMEDAFYLDNYTRERTAYETLRMPHKLVHFCEAKQGRLLATPGAFPFIEGRLLHHALEEPTRLIKLETLKEGVASWIAYMSSHRLHHRDLRPQNCIIRVQGSGASSLHTARLIDFGSTEVPDTTLRDERKMAEKGLSWEEMIDDKVWMRNANDFCKLLRDCADAYGLVPGEI